MKQYESEILQIMPAPKNMYAVYNCLEDSNDKEEEILPIVCLALEKVICSEDEIYTHVRPMIMDMQYADCIFAEDYDFGVFDRIEITGIFNLKPSKVVDQESEHST